MENLIMSNNLPR